jgi:hypothetical protein
MSGARARLDVCDSTGTDAREDVRTDLLDPWCQQNVGVRFGRLVACGRPPLRAEVRYGVLYNVCLEHATWELPAKPKRPWWKWGQRDG